MGWQEANQYRWRCHHDERYFQRAAASRPISGKTKENAPYQSCKIADGKNCETLNEAADGIAWTKKKSGRQCQPDNHKYRTRTIQRGWRLSLSLKDHALYSFVYSILQRLAPVAIPLKNALLLSLCLVTISCHLSVSTLSLSF